LGEGGKGRKGKWEGEVRVYDGTAHEIGVIFAEDEFSRVLIDGIANVEVAEEGGTEETWDVGVIHAVHCN